MEFRQQDMEECMKTNFHGPLNVTRAFLPNLRAKGKSTLLYLSSQAAWHADPSAAGYCSSKFALEGLSRNPASHMRQGNVCVGQDV